MKRREFLQQVSWMLTALGISNISFEQLTHRYDQALAQPAKRKFALLVGINQYPGKPLSGCVTDVALQRELLVTRFGFEPANIVTLTDSQATRQNIETTFIHHLRDQVQPDDLVVFHFSGYGSEVAILEETGKPESDVNAVNVTPNQTETPLNNAENNRTSWQTKVQKCWVPVDGMLALEDGQVMNVILQETLGLLLRSLATEQVITVIDSSYTHFGQDIQGNLRIRARPSLSGRQLDSQEIQLQDQLLAGLKLSRDQLPHDFLHTLPGVVLTAAGPQQLAAESQWEGFSAGLFTYALTQSLWWATPTTKLPISFSRGAGTVEQVSGTQQQPQFSHIPASPVTPPSHSNPPGTLPPLPPLPKIQAFAITPPADGGILAVEDNSKTLQLWLGGMPAHLLETCYQSYFDIFPATPTPESPLARCQIRSRTGITAKAQVISTFEAENEAMARVPGGKPQLHPGQLVQETIRVLPRQVALRVALDPILTRIERVDATSGFASIPQVSVVVGEQPADYIFSRMRDTTIAQSPTAPLPTLSQGRYGLFSLGQTLLTNTMGDSGEAIKTAVQRLTPQLQALLATKMFRLTLNEGVSRLKVKATLAMVKPEARVLMQRESMRATELDHKSYQVQPLAVSGSWSGSSNQRGIPILPLGSRLQCRVRNESDTPIYYLLFALDTAGRSLVLDPMTTPELSMVPVGDAINIPAASETFSWTLYGPEGLAETQLILSRKPFKQTMIALEGGIQPVRETLAFRSLSNPVKVAQAVLQDLKAASENSIQKIGFSSDDIALDINSWASFSFLYRVA